MCGWQCPDVIAPTLLVALAHVEHLCYDRSIDAIRLESITKVIDLRMKYGYRVKAAALSVWEPPSPSPCLGSETKDVLTCQ